MLYLLFLLSFILAKLNGCLAQETPFQWHFTDKRPTLSACETRSVNITGNGKPPYYFIAFDIGGTPTTTLIGDNPNSLQWTVVHPPDHLLMVTIVDSNRTCGGVAPNLYQVQAGESLTCISSNVSQTSSDFTVVANVTTTIGNCEPWGVRIAGGSPSYSVSYVALDSPVLTNITLDPTDDVSTFFDVGGDPNTKMIAAVSDSKGRWAFGTPNVSTHDSPESACRNTENSSGQGQTMAEWLTFSATHSQASTSVTSVSSSSSLSPSSVQSPQSASSSGLSTGAKAGIGIGVAIAALLALGVYLLLLRRRRRTLRQDMEQIQSPQSAAGSNTANVGSRTRSGTHITPFLHFTEHFTESPALTRQADKQREATDQPYDTTTQGSTVASGSVGNTSELREQIREMREQMERMQTQMDPAPPRYSN